MEMRDPPSVLNTYSASQEIKRKLLSFFYAVQKQNSDLGLTHFCVHVAADILQFPQCIF